MKEFLSQHDVSFEEFFVDQDPEALEALKEKIGRWATPTLVIGDEIVVGFEREKIASLLDLGG